MQTSASTQLAGFTPVPVPVDSDSQGLRKPAHLGTILLVEDEECVRDVCALLLNHIGYTVLPAMTGAEALQIFNENAGSIDLLLTDVLMPGMNGSELADKLAALDPQLRIVFMSGYSADSLPGNQARYFLQKPFTRDIMAERLEEAMQSEPGHRITTQ